MGFGASVAGGCSIGNGLVETATMSWKGWIALASMILGAWFMSYFIFIKPMKKAQDRKSTRLNSSHVSISYAVFCLKKKNQTNPPTNNPKDKARKIITE